MNKNAQDPHAPALQWAIVDGILQPISHFTHLAPRERPVVSCPICGRQVIMRLGEVRVHHVAHHPGDVCSAT